MKIDNFGTGYSYLSSLKRFPVDFPKVDNSFVGPLGNDGAEVAITRSIVSLAHSLSLVVIGEEVENAGHLECLTSLGCDIG